MEWFDVAGWFADDVEVVSEPAAAHGDVAHFSVEIVGSEHERPVDGDALGLVDGHRVTVCDVPGFEVGGRELNGPVAQADGHGAPLGVDRFHDAAFAVADIEAPIVAQCHDVIAGLERCTVDHQCRPVEVVGPGGPGEAVEGPDVVSPCREHDWLFTVAACRGPCFNDAGPDVGEGCDSFDPAVGFERVEGLLDGAVAELVQRGLFPGFALAPVLGECQDRKPFGEPAEDTAGIDFRGAVGGRRRARPSRHVMRRVRRVARVVGCRPCRLRR